MSRVVCIAGKYNMAVNGLRYMLDKHREQNIYFLAHASDDGKDSWLPSFRRFAQSHGVAETKLAHAYTIPNLIFISLNYPDIIRPQQFTTTDLFNIHPAYLPKYRGMFTSTMPILNAESRCGATFHRLDAGIDTGDIIDQSSFEILLTDTARDLYFKKQEHCSRLFEKNIASLLAGTFVANPQPAIGATYFSKKAIDFAQLTADFKRTAFQIHNSFRACTFREFQLPEFLRWPIFRTEISDEKSQMRAGSVVHENDRYFVVSTTDYNVRLFKDYYAELWQAAARNDVLRTEHALKFVGDIDLRNKDGQSALMIAAAAGNLACVRSLLRHGANASATDFTGATVLMWAALYYNQTTDGAPFSLLLEHGADHLAKDGDGKTVAEYLDRKGRDALLDDMR